MDLTTTLSFAVQPFEGTYAVTPVLNGLSLLELVTSFEREKEFDVVGGYGGLIPEFFNYGPLDRYFLGDFEPESYFANGRGVYLLGCDCGEVGCWPLTAQIEITGDVVKWSGFGQEHRPARDYAGFGPFVFDADQYRNAVAVLCDELRTPSAADE